MGREFLEGRRSQTGSDYVEVQGARWIPRITARTRSTCDLILEITEPVETDRSFCCADKREPRGDVASRNGWIADEVESHPTPRAIREDLARLQGHGDLDVIGPVLNHVYGAERRSAARACAVIDVEDVLVSVSRRCQPRRCRPA